MINTSEVQQRLRRAYKMMLKFFGVKVMGECEEDTKVTEVERVENFAERFENLTTNPHNNLRITRILLSLGELGAEEYQAPLVRFFLKETLIKNKLPRMKKSAMNFFIPAVRDSQDRQDLLFFAWRYYFPKEEFVWGNHGELAQYKAKPVVAALLPAPLSEWTPVYSEKENKWLSEEQGEYGEDGLVPVEEWTNSLTSNIGSGDCKNTSRKYPWRKKSDGTAIRATILCTRTVSSLQSNSPAVRDMCQEQPENRPISTSREAANRAIPNGIATNRLYSTAALQRIQIPTGNGVYSDRMGGSFPNKN
uniref:Opioid growth factor receptor (OGFr) conserved domain-containing protein n=1 Tax=Leptobrachium leishanense TaxID=445787 RepID=A0A8C5P7D5_9ANUR